MKKLFFGVLAIAGLVACVQEDVLNAPNLKNEIGFGGYVNGAVRTANPSTTTESINHFTVWAYMDNKDGNILTGELVEKSGDAWIYSNVQYWLKKHQYHFFALTPYVAGEANNAEVTLSADPYTNYLGGLAFTNVDGTEDLLYATATPDTFQSIPEHVQFDFDHLLSKVKFTFVNGFTTDNIDIAVTEVKMVVPATASTTLGEQVHNGYEWTGHAGETVLDFGHAGKGARIDATKNAKSDNERLTFPAKVADNLTYKVTFTVDVFVGTQEVSADTHNLEVTVNGVEFVAGKAYNFVAEINDKTLDLKKIEFKVTVDEWDQESNINIGEVGNTEVHIVYSAEELQAVVDGATAGNVSAVFGGDITGDVTIKQKEGVNLTIDGSQYKYTGTFTVNGDARANGAETLTFSNIKFESTEARTFISAPSKINDRYNYSHNVTVKNCTFTGNYPTAEVGGVSLTGTYNAIVKNCTATGMHSLCQFQSCDNTVLVENVEVNGGKNGVSFGNTAHPTLRNAVIEAEAYGVRADGNASRGNLVIENSKITAVQPVIVRKVTTAGYAVGVDEKSTLTTGELYDVIFTAKSDDVTPYVAPSVAFTYNVPAGVNVFPVAEDAVINVDNTTELQGQLAEGHDVALTQDVTIAGSDVQSNAYGATGINILNGQTIDGNGNDISVNAWTTWDSAISTTGGLIKNINVVGGFRGIFVNHNSTHSEKVVLENVKIEGPVYTISCDQGTNQGLEAYNSTFNGWTSYAATIGDVKFVGCNFGEGQGYAFCRPYAATEFVNCDFAAGYELDACAAVSFENCTVGGVALTAENLATLVVGGIANATVK